MTTQISTALLALLADSDAKVLADSLARIEARWQAMLAWKKTDEAEAMRRDQHRYYGTLFNKAGGKSWFQALSGRNEAGRAEVITKNCAAVARKRNATIEAKLNKAGITEIGEAEVIYNKDGFDGIYKAGDKRIKIQTIYAGGYNIQCLHTRVLVSIR
jgi:hypothetical protein